MFRFVRRHASYANVVASLALFVALGGTSYAALKLPQNSVGSKQIRKDAVDTPELAIRSVTSSKLGFQSVQRDHLTAKLRAYLRRQAQAGPQGPPGRDAVAYRVAVGDGGGVVRGSARSVGHTSGSNLYKVDFGVPLDGCVASASPNSYTWPEPGAPAPVVNVSPGGATVQTFGPDGGRAEHGFDLIVAC